MFSKTKKIKKILLQTKKGFPMILMKKIVVNKALIREIVMEGIFVRKIKCKKNQLQPRSIRFLFLSFNLDNIKKI